MLYLTKHPLLGRGLGRPYSFFRSETMLTLSSMMAFSSLMATRSCFIVSRKRRVTQPSFSVSWSTVTQYGVPMAS